MNVSCELERCILVLKYYECFWWWCFPASSQSLLKFTSIELVMRSNHLILYPLLFCLQSCPVSGSLPMSWLFTTGGQSIGASASILPTTLQGWFPLGLTGLISLLSKGLSRVKSSPAQFKRSNSLALSLLYGSIFIPIHATRRTLALTIRTFVSKVMSLFFNTLSRFVIAFLPVSKHHLVSWLESPSTVILEPKKIKSVTASTLFRSLCHEVMGLDTMILVFWMLNFKPAFSLVFYLPQEAL